ncbi:hypothetical protein BH18ACT1_BH18ACT1_19570 [soil metagenome]
MRRAAALGGIALGLGLIAALWLGATALPEEERPRLVAGATTSTADPAAAVEAACRDRRPKASTSLQTSAPRSGVPGGSVVELGLRDRVGTGSRAVEAEVVAPSGEAAIAIAQLDGDAWAYLRYPADFAGAPAPRAGTYRVGWRGVGGGAVACDGFVVRGAS